MTEREVQILVWRWAINHSTSFLCILPNSGILGHEADVVKVMPSGRTTEFEIKCSLKDLRAEQRKQWKWHSIESLRNGHTEGVRPGNRLTERFVGPNYFFYVLEHAWIEKVAIPEWAGILVYSSDHTRVVLHRPAALLHKGKIGEMQYRKLLRSMSWKLWNTKVESGGVK